MINSHKPEIQANSGCYIRSLAKFIEELICNEAIATDATGQANQKFISFFFFYKPSKEVKMPVKSKENLIGAWSFLIGVILAVIIGLFKAQLGAAAGSAILAILVILGLVVGLLNVGDKNANAFLLAGLALVIVSFMGANALGVIPQIGEILNTLLIMFIPATVIVALKSVFSISKE